ncbi:MAG TPA: hypothetical protein VGM02_06060 [Acidobacteriaceae bacterium]|jgi:hypothetical protein
MKMYVLGYRSKEYNDETGKTVALLYEVEIQYTTDPEWKMPFRELAELERDNLQRMQVHIGPHYCNFSIEQLSGSDFAIVCLSHP